MSVQMDPRRDGKLRLNSSKLVFVSCKLPHGLRLEVGEVGTDKYEHIQLKGSRTNGMRGLAAVTPVPQDLWDRWHKTHQWMQCVKDGLVQAHPTMEHAQAAGFANLEQRTGLEPLKGHDLPKNSRGENEIEIDTEHMKKLGVSLQ